MIILISHFFIFSLWTFITPEKNTFSKTEQSAGLATKIENLEDYINTGVTLTCENEKKNVDTICFIGALVA